MKKLLLLFFVFCFSLCEGQSWVWGTNGIVKAAPPIMYGEGSAITQDTKNNVILTGYFSDTVLFGSYMLTGSIAPDVSNVFVVKYDKNGQVKWAKQSSNSNNVLTSVSIATDINDNVFITGNFTGTIHFGALTVTSGVTETFLVKYDSNGNPLWAKQSMGATPSSYGVAADKWGNSYITGYFTDSVAFGSHYVKNSSTQLFLVKYNPNGNVIWAKQSTNSSPYCFAEAFSIATDLNGNVFLTGYTDSLTIDTIHAKPGPVFIVKFDSSGHALWTNTATIPKDTIGSVETSSVIKTDASGNVIISGNFNYNLIFGSDTIIDPSVIMPNILDIFIAKYSSTGNLDWVDHGYGFNGDWISYSLATDNTNNVYVTASSFPDGINIIFGNDTITGPLGTDPSLIAEFDSTGMLTCGKIYSFGGDDWQGITVDPLGNNIYFGGDLIGQQILGADTVGPDSNINNGIEYPLVAKWVPCNVTTEINQIKLPDSVTLFPNPNNGAFNIGIRGKEQGVTKLQIEIYNVLGEKVYSKNYQPMTINLSSQPNGIYLYRVITETGALVSEGKFIIQK